jgi:hypothetical protein
LLCCVLPCFADDDSSFRIPSCTLVCSKYAKQEANDSTEED